MPHNTRHSKAQRERGLRLQKIFKKVYKNKSRAEIAAYLGVSYGAIGPWFKGASINGDILEKLSRDGADLHYLFTGEAAKTVITNKKGLNLIQNHNEDPKIYCLGRLACIEAKIREDILRLADKLTKINEYRQHCLYSEDFSQNQAIKLYNELQQNIANDL